MKFSNGMWMPREGYQIDTPKQVYSAEILKDSLTAFAPFVYVNHRGNTLDGGLLTVTLSSPLEDVVCVKIENHKGGRGKKAQFALKAEGSCGFVREETSCYVLKTGDTEISLNRGAGFELKISHQGKPVAKTAPRGAAHITAPDGTVYLRERLALDVGEMIYGLGEHFGPFVKNGQSIDMWNADGGTDSEQSYKCVPFFLSNKGYGVFVRDCGPISFEVGTEAGTATQFSTAGESLEYYIFAGGIRRALYSYTALFGRAPLVPDWSFGLWLSSSFTTDYSEKTIMAFIDGMLQRDIPLSVFHFDCFWMKEYEWCNFLWNTDLFPDPKGMIQRIHERGIRVCVWINPYIAQKSPLFEEGLQGNYFVNTGSGDVWQWDKWQAGMALVDFTNPDAVRWYQSKLSALVDMGVDSFKTDFGERIPVADSFYGIKAAKEGIAYFDGSDAIGMHNYYAYLYNKAVYDLLQSRLGQGQACLFARSATAGAQSFPVHWGGDNLSNYPSMAQSLRGGLSLALCGFAYWSHDIGGFESGCEPDIYKRWTQFGLLSSHSRYHGNSEYKVPWLYGDEAVEVTRRFTKLKNRLLPYLGGLAFAALSEGLPLMRPMLLEFSERACAALDAQYMLGDTLLVAPIFSNNGCVEYYLPEGRWVSLLTGEVVEGGLWRKETHGYMTLPLLMRENHLLPLGNDDSSSDYDYSQSLSLAIGHITDGAEIVLPIYAAGAQLGCIQARRLGDEIKVETEGFKPEITLELLESGQSVTLPCGNGVYKMK